MPGGISLKKEIKMERLKSLPENEQPYVKCEKLGPKYLTDSELLSVILRSGSKKLNSLETAREILKITGPDQSISGIEHIGDSELLAIPGIGPVKVILLRCLTEYSKRLWNARIRCDVRLDHPRKIAAYFMEDMRHLTVEEVRVVLLDTRSNYLGSQILTRGLSDRSLVSPKELFSCALRRNASQVILIHNHPSGDPTPSRDDLLLTERLIEAGGLIGIPLSDSLIIGDGVYVSLRENRLVKLDKGE